MRTLVAVAMAFSALAACGSDRVEASLQADDPEAINKSPTGSISIPSLCDRTGPDRRVTYGGADTFALAWAGDRYQLVYGDTGVRDVYSLQLDIDGTSLAPSVPVEVTSGDSGLPTLLHTVGGFIVAWQDDDERATVRVRRLDRTGVPVGEARLVAVGRSPHMRPVLSHSPDGVAIAWMDRLPTTDTNDEDLGDSMSFVGTLDDQLSLRTDPPPQPIDAGARTAYPSLAGDERSLALLWNGDRDGPTDTYFGTVDVGLTLRGDHLIRDGGSSRPALLERLSGSDRGYLAAWQDKHDGADEIYLALLDTDGVAHYTGLVEEPDTGSATAPHMAELGSALVVVYGQFRGGHPQIFLTFFDENGARIGGAADAQISNTPASARFPDVVWNGTDLGVFWIDARDGQAEIYYNRVSCRRPVPI